MSSMIISTGGTGGHVIPAKVFYDYFKEKFNVKIISDKRGLNFIEKENYNVNDFFNGRISNYRMLASIYNVFQSESSQEQFKPDHIVNSKVTILEHITNKKSSKGKIQEQMIWRKVSVSRQNWRLGGKRARDRHNGTNTLAK